MGNKLKVPLWLWRTPHPEMSVHGGDQQGRIELDELLLADDCVTDMLLDDIYKAKKYIQSFIQ
jgi:hypothetical protein